MTCDAYQKGVAEDERRCRGAGVGGDVEEGADTGVVAGLLESEVRR